MRIPALVVALAFVSSTASAQIVPLATIDLTGPDSPLSYPAPYWLVEVDAKHPGPELLIAQLNPFGPGWMLSLAIHDHPRVSGVSGARDTPGICFEPYVVTDIDFWSPFLKFTAIDLNGDGRTDAVEFGDPVSDINTRVRPFMLGPLNYCRTHQH